MIAIPLSWLLHFFESLPLVNYGLAIILLTVLVRSAMMPLSRKAAKNAQMMQELAPEMKRIAEKYKTDMEKRGVAQRELFAKHNYNPFGGCLLMFVQLPIFIGLYRALSVDIELLQAPLIPGFWWCSNLAGPDMLWYWEPYLFAFFADPGTGWLGPFFNVLPIVTIVLFLVQQKMFMPPATDEQTRMQQQMMKYMNQNFSGSGRRLRGPEQRGDRCPARGMGVIRRAGGREGCPARRAGQTGRRADPIRHDEDRPGNRGPAGGSCRSIN
jgi:YidC/Oxa1 family membrane protein insertase